MRRRNYRRSRIRKESRTIPLYGDKERGNGLDDGRYYRCWNCGFICNIDRDALGNSESRDGISYEDFPIPVYGADNAVDNSDIARLGGSMANQTLVCLWDESIFPSFYPGEYEQFKTNIYSRRNPVGSGYGMLGRKPMMRGVSVTIMVGIWTEPIPLVDRYHIKPDVDSGCPFCGTLNWKGDF